MSFYKCLAGQETGERHPVGMWWPLQAGLLVRCTSLRLHRSSTLDWPVLLKVMQFAIEQGDDHIEAARHLADRLFSRSMSG